MSIELDDEDKEALQLLTERDNPVAPYAEIMLKLADEETDEEENPDREAVPRDENTEVEVEDTPKESDHDESETDDGGLDVHLPRTAHIRRWDGDPMGIVVKISCDELVEMGVDAYDISAVEYAVDDGEFVVTAK